MDCLVLGVVKSRTSLSDFHFHSHRKKLSWDSAGTSKAESDRVKGDTLDGVLWEARRTELEIRP